MISIDGSIIEGGGQILRMSMSLSALLSKPIEIYNIRGKRSSPGLKSQHLIGLQIVQQLTRGELIGAHMGSTKITFTPKGLYCDKYYGDIKTAGSVMLLLQISLPCLLFANGQSQLMLSGGTNAEMAPQIDSTLMVLKPILEKFGIKFSCDIICRGYFPKGRGKISVTIDPVEYIRPIVMLEQGSVTKICGYSFVAGTLPIKMSHVMADSANQILRKSFPNVPIHIERVKEDPNKAFGNGSGIVLSAHTSEGCVIGGSALGKRSETCEKTGENAAEQLIEDIMTNATVDRYTQDQMIIFMALAKGKSSVRTGPLTLHTQTAIHIVKLLTDAKFNIIEVSDNENIIECDGIGFINSSI